MPKQPMCTQKRKNYSSRLSHFVFSNKRTRETDIELRGREALGSKKKVLVSGREASIQSIYDERLPLEATEIHPN